MVLDTPLVNAEYGLETVMFEIYYRLRRFSLSIYIKNIMEIKSLHDDKESSS